MSTVLLVAHHDRSEAADLCGRAIGWLASHGHAVLMTPDDAAALGVDRGRVSWTGDPGSADVAVSLGGDGTMLRTTG